MNERIKELVEQAYRLADGDVNAQYEKTGHCAIPFNELYNQRFAELIIQECLAKAEEEAELYRGFSHLGGAEYAKVMYNYQLLLKEHFGVEE